MAIFRDKNGTLLHYCDLCSICPNCFGSGQIEVWIWLMLLMVMFGVWDYEA